MPRVVIYGDGWVHLCSIVGGVRVYVGLCVSVCRFKTPPCVDSKRLRVFRQNARVSCDTFVCWHTQRRFESTHGGFQRATPHTPSHHTHTTHATTHATHTTHNNTHTPHTPPHTPHTPTHTHTHTTTHHRHKTPHQHTPTLAVILRVL